MKFIIIAISASVIGIFIFTATRLADTPQADIHKPTPATTQPPSTPTALPSPRTEYIDHNVPFASQAPLGQWSDPVFQDGCEEASILMAVRWAQGVQSITPGEATSLIQDMSDWQIKHDGEFRDRSVIDTADLATSYLDYEHVDVIRNISQQDIIHALLNDSVVVVPAAGQELLNPNFTPPGPLNHMLVIRGYDPDTREFITNDPGTRNGAGFRYDQDVLFNAIRDYPTGYQEQNESIEKHMLVIRK